MPDPLDGGVVSDIDFRHETESDFPRVFETQRAAFDSAVQARLVEIVRACASPSLSLVATVDDELVGHIFFSPVTIESASAFSAAQLSPVAVRPTHQGRGVGSALIRAGLCHCSSKGWSAVFLVGNPLYYSRFGFEMARPRGLSCGGPHDPFLQVLELEPGAISNVRGHVEFHPAFADLESE